MARSATWQDIARITRRVDRHDKDIADLQELSAADHETARLQAETLGLLGRLSEIHTRRITRVEGAVARIRRRIEDRRR